MSTANKYAPGAWKPQWKIDRILRRQAAELDYAGGEPVDGRLRPSVRRALNASRFRMVGPGYRIFSVGPSKTAFLPAGEHPFEKVR